MNTTQFDHKKYPIIIGKKYQYFDLNGEKLIKTNEYAIIQAVDLDRDVFKLEFIDNFEKWYGNYGAFIYHWKIKKSDFFKF